MKNFTFGLFMLLGTSAFAQIPNAGFETWTDPNTPANWSVSSTTLAGLGVAPNVSQETTTVSEGSSAIKLTSVAIFGGAAVASGAISSGNITYNGTAMTLEFDGGFPYTGRPGQLTGMMQYAPAGNDSAQIWVLLTRWNTGTGARETIASGLHNYGATASAYTPFGITLNYVSSADPDTALIVALSTKTIVATPPAVAGSVLWLDDLAFEFGAGINGVGNEKTIHAYPNPTTDVLNIDMNAGEYTNAMVYDLTGRLVNTLAIEGTSVNVSSLNKGQYVMELRNDNGRVRLVFAKQ